MSFLKILKRNKQINNMINVENPTNASISIDNNNINFSINGIPAYIDMQYEGAVSFSRKMPILIKSFIDKNKILITNIFRQEIPDLLYIFSGNLKIISCKIMTYDGFVFSATINNNSQSTLLESQDTKPEDDTVLLFEEADRTKEKIRRGQVNYGLKGNAVDESGNIVIPPKDIDFIATTVYKGALQMQANRNLSKEQPQLVKPSPIASPVKTLPKTTTSSVKEEKGKY